MIEKRVIPLEMLRVACEQTLELVEFSVPNTEVVSLRYFLASMLNYLDDAIQKADDGWPIIGHHFAFPAEVLYYFDCVPIAVEGASYLFSALWPDGAEPYYDALESYGHPFHTCSAQKGAMGLNLEGLFKYDVVVTPSGPCDNSIASYPIFQNLQKDQKVKFFDMPVYSDKRTEEYLAKELSSFKDDLGKMIGQKPDEEKFRKAVETEGKGIQLVKEINDLKKAIPCPFESLTVPIISGATVCFNAHPEKNIFLENLLEYGKQNYRNKIKPNGEEKLRTIWPNMTLFFDVGYAEELERKRGLSILFDIFNYIFYDPIDLSQDINGVLEQLAHHARNKPMVRQAAGLADQMIEDMIYLAKEYQIDAAIFTNHVACKSLQPVIQLLREALREELGIPFLSVDVDVGDKRFASSQTIRTEVDNFLETLY